MGLTLFFEIPVAQIIATIILMSFCLYTVLRYRPFEKSEKNILEAGNRVFYILILLVFLIGHLTEKKMSERARFECIGFGVIGLVSLLICLNILVSLWAAYKSSKKMLSKSKETNQKEKSAHQHQLAGRRQENSSIQSLDKRLEFSEERSIGNSFDFLNEHNDRKESKTERERDHKANPTTPLNREARAQRHQSDKADNRAEHHIPENGSKKIHSNSKRRRREKKKHNRRKDKRSERKKENKGEENHCPDKKQKRGRKRERTHDAKENTNQEGDKKQGSYSYF